MKKIRFYILFFVVVFGTLSMAAQKVWTADNIPIPYLQDSTQYVSDPEGYATKQQKDSANYYLGRLKWECGVQNVLIIVGHVDNQDAFRMAQGVCGPQKTESRGLQDLAFFEGTCPFWAKNYGFLVRVAETSTYVKVLQLCRFSPSLATIPKNAPVFSFILSVCSYFFCKFPLVFHGK